MSYLEPGCRWCCIVASLTPKPRSGGSAHARLKEEASFRKRYVGTFQGLSTLRGVLNVTSTGSRKAVTTTKCASSVRANIGDNQPFTLTLAPTIIFRVAPPNLCLWTAGGIRADLGREILQSPPEKAPNWQVKKKPKRDLHYDARCWCRVCFHLFIFHEK